MNPMLRSYYLLWLLLVLLLIGGAGCDSPQEDKNGKPNVDSLMAPSMQPASFDTTDLHPTNELMPLDRYWDIVAQSLKTTTYQEAQTKWLENYLATLPPMDIMRFRQRTSQLEAEVYTSEMWCAAYMLGGGCSDDCFDYFRLWLISKGKELYQKAKANPDNLADYMTPESGIMGEENEGYGYAPAVAFRKVTGREIYDYCTAEIAYVPIEDQNWNEDEPESMRRICPRIWAKLHQ